MGSISERPGKINAGDVLLTVLLPVRNETMNLRVMLRILRSVIVVPHEIIVIFDSETDTSIPIVEEVRTEYAQVRPLLNRLGRGVAGAITAGVDAARGERPRAYHYALLSYDNQAAWCRDASRH